MSAEQDLIEKIQRGDTEAFATLVEQYKERALRAAYGFAQNWEDAKDISQNAFIKAYRKLGGFKGESGFYTWYYRILANTAKDFLRRRWWHRFRQHATGSDANNADPLDSLPSKTPMAGNIVLSEELLHCIERFMADLPWAQKQVVLLRYNDHLGLEEIALRLKKAVGTVKAQLFTAHRELRRRLKDYEGGTCHA